MSESATLPAPLEHSPLFDTHCHFDFSAFDADRLQQWRNAQAIGVRYLMIPGVAPDQWPQALEICRQVPGIFCAAGVHPWWIERLQLSADASHRAALEETLFAFITTDACRAIGECGLDKLIDTPLELQLAIVEWHMHWAATLQKPLILHCVRAHNEMQRLLKKVRPAAGGVMHAFSGSYEIAADYWSMGFYLGIGGGITYERAHKTRAAIQRMPLEALVLETDAPDMPLQGHQGQRNNPDALAAIVECLAQLRGESPEQIMAQTFANACRLFAVEP